MKNVSVALASLGFLSLLCVSKSALAEDSATTVVDTPKAGQAETEAPPAHTGFQLALRTGAAIPMGSASGAPGSSMSNFVGVQVPVMIDIGAKIIPQLFVGAYGGLAIGAAGDGSGGGLANGCGQNGTTCASATWRFGIEAQYHIIPDGKINPWVGYGIGLESTGVGITPNGGSTTTYTAAGWDFAHIMAGLDFRLGRVFGLGPYADFSIGQYTKSSDSVTNNTVDIPQTAMHEWLALGVRGTFFP